MVISHRTIVRDVEKQRRHGEHEHAALQHWAMSSMVRSCARPARWQRAETRLCRQEREAQDTDADDEIWLHQSMRQLPNRILKFGHHDPTAQEEAKDLSERIKRLRDIQTANCAFLAPICMIKGSAAISRRPAPNVPAGRAEQEGVFVLFGSGIEQKHADGKATQPARHPICSQVANEKAAGIAITK